MQIYVEDNMMTVQCLWQTFNSISKWKQRININVIYFTIVTQFLSPLLCIYAGCKDCSIGEWRVPRSNFIITLTFLWIRDHWLQKNLRLWGGVCLAYNRCVNLRNGGRTDHRSGPMNERNYAKLNPRSVSRTCSSLAKIAWNYPNLEDRCALKTVINFQ